MILQRLALLILICYFSDCNLPMIIYYVYHTLVVFEHGVCPNARTFVILKRFSSRYKSSVPLINLAFY